MSTRIVVERADENVDRDTLPVHSTTTKVSLFGRLFPRWELSILLCAERPSLCDEDVKDCHDNLLQESGTTNGNFSVMYELGDPG